MKRNARVMLRLGVAAVVAYGVLVEGRHMQANQRLRRPRPDASRALLVLGCPPTRDGALSRTQQWRVDLALRAWRPGDRLVFSGAALPGLPSEADVMGAYAARCGVPAADIVLESQARSTWENVLYARPWLTESDEVMVVSDPLHAARALRMLADQAPELAGKAVRVPGYRVGEHAWRKIVSAAFESPLKSPILWVHGRKTRGRRPATRL